MHSMKMKPRDKTIESIMNLINNSHEPLETKEFEEKLPKETRTKILYRLKELRGEGLIGGKMVGASKGTWIWWKKGK